jgi:hypothetical protein
MGDGGRFEGKHFDFQTPTHVGGRLIDFGRRMKEWRAIEREAR